MHPVNRTEHTYWQAEVGCDEHHGYEAPLTLLLVLTTCLEGIHSN